MTDENYLMGMDDLHVDILLRGCRAYAASRVVWRLKDHGTSIDEIAVPHGIF